MTDQSDKELLELAAKAAGFTYRTSPEWHNTGAPQIWDGNDWIDWNPLTDDGDALRLAVKLGIDVCIDTAQERPPQTQAIGFAGDGADTVDAIEFHGDDHYAATRRAIVRAAASIGKSGEA